MLNATENNKFFEELETHINKSRTDIMSEKAMDEIDARIDNVDPTVKPDVPEELVEFANIRPVFSLTEYHRSHNLFERIIPIDLGEIKHLEIKLHKKTFDRPDAFLHIELVDGLNYCVDLAS